MIIHATANLAVSGPSLTAQLHLKFYTAVSAAHYAGACSAVSAAPCLPRRRTRMGWFVEHSPKGRFVRREQPPRDSNTEPSEKLVNVTHLIFPRVDNPISGPHLDHPLHLPAESHPHHTYYIDPLRR